MNETTDSTNDRCTDDENEREDTSNVELNRNSNMRPSNRRSVPTFQNNLIVWLHSSMDELHGGDYSTITTELRKIVNTLAAFSNTDECIDFIDSIKEEAIFIICSGVLGHTTVPAIHDKQQISDIYVLCENKLQDEQWTKEWRKVKGVFTEIQPICEALKRTIQDCDFNAVSISVANRSTLDCSFMYTQVLKDILLAIEFDDGHIKDFLVYSREILAGNERELQNVDKIQKEYRDRQPIWWYTYESYLYSMLNRALRLMDVNAILKLAFFLCDLHNDIKELHAKQLHGHTFSKSFVVFRGQKLSKKDFDQLKQNQGGLIAFNNFLSTTNDRNICMGFLNRYLGESDLINILFVISIDSSIESTPFANIKDASYFKGEEEVLLSMHSVFRIGQIKKLIGTNEIWEVQLTLTTDLDRDLEMLSEFLRKECFPHKKGWYRLGSLLLKMGQFDKAQELFELMLRQTTDATEKPNLYHMLGNVKFNLGKYMEAIEYFHRSIEIQQIDQFLRPTDLIISYNSLAAVYEKMGEYVKALEYNERALELSETTVSLNSNLFRNVDETLDERSMLIQSFENTMKALLETHPEDDLFLASEYDRFGYACKALDANKEARSFYERALQIKQKRLCPIHPSIADTMANYADVLEIDNDPITAHTYRQRATQIRELSLPQNHPDRQVHEQQNS